MILELLIYTTTGLNIIPVDRNMVCQCIEVSENVDCNVRQVLFNGTIENVLTTTDHGKPVATEVRVGCRER